MTDAEVAVDGDDEEDVRTGLVALVLALVEIVDDALEREAVRRMDAGDLTDEEVDRLGEQLRRLDREIERLEEREGVSEEVRRLRDQLDGALDDAVRGLSRDEL